MAITLLANKSKVEAISLNVLCMEANIANFKGCPSFKTLSKYKSGIHRIQRNQKLYIL
jgi:hypothetical protein